MREALFDIVDSRSRALREHGWLYGEMFNRIGNPFVWIDGSQLEGLFDTPLTIRFLQYLAMSGEIYETPQGIRTADHDRVLAEIELRLGKALRMAAGFLDVHASGFHRYVRSTASVKTQDYCAIRTYCTELPVAPVQLDIGPGLGANALYSVYCLGGRYVATDAFPPSIDAQRNFFRIVAESPILDSIDAQAWGKSETEIRALLRDPQFPIVLLPTWHLPLYPEKSIDLASATWVLNEVNSAGIVWLLFHAARVLKIGGYFYIRDSRKLKPNRHALDYDAALIKLGFEAVGELAIVNRVDMHGIPRVYRKRAEAPESFVAAYNLFFSHFDVTSHGGQYEQLSADAAGKP